MRRSRTRMVPLLACLLSLAACATSGPGAEVPAPSASTVPSSAAPSTQPDAATPTTPSSKADLAYDRMDPRQRVGQLFMFGVTSTGPPQEMYDELAAHAAGNMFLRGSSDLGVDATARITDRIATVGTVADVRPFVSADQEGGNAQSLTGAGFSTMPTAVTQGGQQPRDLRADAGSWAGELLAAGVNLDLAPVADVVPADVGAANDPIGYFHRQYGSTPGAAAPGVGAFVRGMQRGGVAATIKHFPGLGRATGNTDSDPTATDPTVRGDALLAPFTAGVRARTAFAMVSSANYPGIDPDRRACFSPLVIRDMLRGDLSFEGVIVSDSFGSASVSSVRPGRRAIRFFGAGGTMVLDTNYLDAGPMSTAVLDRMDRDPDFAETIEGDVRLVLAAKERFGLLG